MVYKGHIEDGRVVLNEDVQLPNGVQVDVVLASDGLGDTASAAKQADEGPTWYDTLKDVIGKAEGLPSDFALNHDHYIHGAPKR